MGNEVTTRGGNYIANVDDYYAALAAEAESYKGGGTGVNFLKFNGNDGYYSFGADDVDLPLGTRAALDPTSLKRGWICWVGGQVKEEIMLSIVEGQPPQKHQLPDHGPYGEDDGWSEQKTVEFTITDDPEAPEGAPEPGVRLLFQANNTSKLRALEAVMKDFARTFRNHAGLVPVVEFDEREFEGKAGKNSTRKVTKHAPVFKIAEWVDPASLASLAEGDPEDYQDEGAEAPAQAALPAPEPEPEPEAPAPAARAARGGRVQREAPAAAAPAQAAAPAARGGRVQREAPAPAAPAPAAAERPQRGRRF